ncbi:MAG: glycosyltransferase [Pseudomonadota bacterium]
MKHVLALSTIYPNAANPRFGTFVARSMESLAKRGDWRVSVINPIGIPPLGLGALSPRFSELAALPEREEIGGVTIHRPQFTLIPKIGARRNVKAILRAALPVARAIHEAERVLVADAQYFFPDGPAAAALAEALGAPLSIKARGSDINYWGGVGFAREAMLGAARQATGLLAVSEALAREMVRLGMRQEAITVHYTGLDRDLFRPFDHTQLRAQLGEALGLLLPDAAPLFACVGALNGRKGQDIAILALARLSEDYPEAQLILVGTGEEEAALRSLARECGVGAHVHFTGSVDHTKLPLILSAADAMVLPTENEGLANAWVEAIACGTPVVTSDVGGARELVRSEVAGRLTPRDPVAVAEALRAILRDPPTPEAVAAHAQDFNWTTHAAALAAHYDRLIESA